MPKLPPPPRSPQNRSALSVALAVRRRPSAVTTSAESRLSQVKPYMRCNQPMPPPQGEACDARRRYRPTGGSQPERLRLAVELPPGQARLCARDAGGRIHAHALHRREVDDDAVVADG